MKRGWEIVRIRTRDFFQFRFDVRELIGQHGLEQGSLGWEISIKRFLAHAQLFCQIIHGYTAEPVAEEMRPRRFHDSLPASLGRSVSQEGFSRVFHVNICVHV